MNIIFLDIDGVLNCYSTYVRHKYCHMDESCTKLLYKTIKEIPNIKIVISSSWRCPGNIERFKEKCKVLKSDKLFSKFIPYLHDDYCTKRLCTRKRGNEIKEWLSRHDEVEKYICLDDDSDYYSYQPLLIINREIGFSRYDKEIVLQYFGIPVHHSMNIDIQIKHIGYTRRLLTKRLRFLNKYFKHI